MLGFIIGHERRKKYSLSVHRHGKHAIEMAIAVKQTTPVLSLRNEIDGLQLWWQKEVGICPDITVTS